MRVNHEDLESQHLTNAEDIYRTLRALQLHRSLITLTLSGNAQIGSSLVLDADLDNQWLLVDQLSDTYLQAQLSPGQALTLRASYGGVQVSGIFGILEIINDQGESTIKLGFPKELMHRQRRAAFRVNLTAPLTTIYLASKQRETPIGGVIVDISADGLAVEFDTFVRPPILPNEFFHTARFSYKDEEWEIALIAKHPSFDKQTDKYRCGFSFQSLSASQSKAINQWVLQLQRDNQKRGPFRGNL